jgi:hypothetical protein
MHVASASSGQDVLEMVRDSAPASLLLMGMLALFAAVVRPTVGMPVLPFANVPSAGYEDIEEI